MSLSLVETSEQLLSYLLNYKSDFDPNFTFSLRQRNSPQAKEVDRLGEGYWFQGSNYIYIPLFRKGDNARKIKTIGFVVSINGYDFNNYIEISFKDPTHSKDDRAFHKDLAEFQGVNLDGNNVGHFYFENQNQIFENLQFYITEFREKAVELLTKHNLLEKYLISEIDFQKALSKINNIRKPKLLKMSDKETELLLYKKQIILQGPPGTGKTRLAKQIARKLLIKDVKNSFTESDLLAIVKEKTIINTFTNYNSFEIIKVDNNSFKIYPKGAKLEYKVFFSDVIDCIKDFDANDLVKKYDKKGVGSYLVGIAKYVVDNLETARQQIIQFHPSYTYEDFVRGIMVKPNPDGEGVLYEAENKILGAFANEAFLNYKLSREQVSISVSDVDLFDLFINDIKAKIADSDEQRFSLTDAVYLFEPDEKRFKYKGDNWIAHSKGLNMKFSELQKIIAANITERAQVKQLDGVEELTKQHATYFIKVVEMFYEFKSNHSSNQTNKEIKTTLRNYVLIIDEINRANLSSVLGELIYALEYRGETVESMYAIDGDSKLTLPPNLYIIGTMNTADRSVGHIDYAIRRRFAFIDVLPEILAINDFDKDLFITVAKLFVREWDNQWEPSSYLSPEFAPKDVMLGHSYFIKQYEKDDSGNNINDKPYDFKMRVKYEIVPILREYVKDGILNEKAILVIDKIEDAFQL